MRTGTLWLASENGFAISCILTAKIIQSKMLDARKRFQKSEERMRRKKALSEDAAQPSTHNPAFSLNGNLEKHLLAYATAASAVLGFLALESSARAEVVFTPTNET